MNIREIANRARVSHSTVSRVINNVSAVDPKLARRVQAVIEDVGYRPNFQAQALARGKSRTVGLVVSELSGGNPFFAEIILYFERAAVSEGYEVLISFADTEANPEDVVICTNRMKERHVDGIAILTFGMEQHLQRNNGSGQVPMVFVGSKIALEGVRNIRINYLSGMKGAVAHLLEFGHQRIGYLSGLLRLSSMQIRYDALRKTLKSGGVDLRKEYVAECNHTLEGGAAGMAELLNLPRPPTAVLCCNDMAAIGALKTLGTRNLRAGKDISLIGFDDLPLCKFMQPALSTIRFAPIDLAKLAFSALLDAIESTDGKQGYEYETKFVLRESTGAPSGRG